MSFGITALISPSILCKSSPSSDSPGTLSLHNVCESPQSPSSSTAAASSSMAIRRQKQASEAQSNSVLSKKRPARLAIPIVSVDLNGNNDVDDRVDLVEVEEEGYSVYCKKGKRGLGRTAMEDRYAAIVNRRRDCRQAFFFGVFDGHGGSKAAEFAAEEMGKNMLDRIARRSEEEIEQAIKECYLVTDEQFSEMGGGGGACCLTALIRGGDLAVSNAGDCRAVLSRKGRAEALSSDHRPSRDDERSRIENLGGYIECRNGVWRVEGSLGVSRGIGDGHLKKWVISEPETVITRISHDCEFLILASDGLWDKVSNEEAVDLVRSLCVSVESPKLLLACKKMADLSIARGSIDDICVMIVKLSSFVELN